MIGTEVLKLASQFALSVLTASCLEKNHGYVHASAGGRYTEL